MEGSSFEVDRISFLYTLKCLSLEAKRVVYKIPVFMGHTKKRNNLNKNIIVTGKRSSPQAELWPDERVMNDRHQTYFCI